MKYFVIVWNAVAAAFPRLSKELGKLPKATRAVVSSIGIVLLVVLLYLATTNDLGSEVVGGIGASIVTLFHILLATAGDQPAEEPAPDTLKTGESNE